MRLSRDEFLRWENKAITLLGMSGVGKTVLACKLPKAEWFHYSGDYRIGTKYLAEPILDDIKRQAMQVPFLRDLLRSDSIFIGANLTVDNLEPMCRFLGKVGDPARGGLPLEELKRRHRLHRDAEINAMKDVATFLEKGRNIYGYPHFINDAGGSICVLDDPEPIEVLCRHTLILYLRADEAMETELIARQRRSPKPLYYQASFLDQQLADYLREARLDAVDGIDPDEFTRWIFPRLVAHRRPRYEAIAAQCGYAVDAREAESVRDEGDFLELVGAALARHDEAA